MPLALIEFTPEGAPELKDLQVTALFLLLLALNSRLQDYDTWSAVPFLNITFIKV
jgi:hypothetical protein